MIATVPLNKHSIFSLNWSTIPFLSSMLPCEDWGSGLWVLSIVSCQNDQPGWLTHNTLCLLLESIPELTPAPPNEMENATDATLQLQRFWEGIGMELNLDISFVFCFGLKLLDWQASSSPSSSQYFVMTRKSMYLYQPYYQLSSISVWVSKAIGIPKM